MQLQVVVVESKFRHEDAALLLCPDGMLQEHSVGRLDVGPVLERGGEHAVGCSKRTLIRRLRNDAQDVGDEFAVINFIVRGTRCRSSGEGARKINCFVKPLMLLRPTFDVFFRGDELRSCHEDAIVAEIPFRVLEADQSALSYSEPASSASVKAQEERHVHGWYLVLAATMEAGSSLTME